MMMSEMDSISLVEAQDLLLGGDVLALGRRAGERRRTLWGGTVVTYHVPLPGDHQNDGLEQRLLFDPATGLAPLSETLQATAVVPIWGPGATAVEYLKLIAVCRLYLPASAHLQLDAGWSGMKIAQIALTFGADDFGNIKPGTEIAEEEVRCVIRDAGFIPKRRDREYRSLALD